VNARPGRRWPPAGPRHPEPPPDDYVVDWPGAIGDLSKALQHLAPGTVLGEATYALSAAGQAGDQYRAPYAALAITSFSASQLTITEGTLKASAPGPGPGSAIVAPRGFRVVNMKGYAWSLYGGQSGDLVTVEAFTRPQNADAGSVGALVIPPAVHPASVYRAGLATAPLIGTAIVTLPVLAAGLWTITVTAGFGGTAEATTPDNFSLNLGGAVLYSSLAVPAVINSMTPVGKFLVASDGVNAITLKNPVAASAGAIYHGALQADQ
jgi:hypothetical protein